MERASWSRRNISSRALWINRQRSASLCEMRLIRHPSLLQQAEPRARLQYDEPRPSRPSRARFHNETRRRVEQSAYCSRRAHFMWRSFLYTYMNSSQSFPVLRTSKKRNYANESFTQTMTVHFTHYV